MLAEYLVVNKMLHSKTKLAFSYSTRLQKVTNTLAYFALAPETKARSKI
jgi:hypothetical protein